MFQNFRNNIFHIGISLGKTGTKLTFMNNISAHKNTFRAKRNIFHIFRNIIRTSLSQSEHVPDFIEQYSIIKEPV